MDLVTARIQTKAPLRRSKSQDAETYKHSTFSKSGKSEASQPKLREAGSRDDYADMFTAIRTIYRSNGGLSGFYQGIASDTLSTALSQFLYFYMFAALMRLFNKHVQIAADANKAGGGKINSENAKVVTAAIETAVVKVSGAKELLIGSIAGILSRGVTTPLSTITVRKQTAAKARPAAETRRRNTSATTSSNASSESLKLGWGKVDDSLHREYAVVQQSSSNVGDYGNDDDDEEDEDYAPDSSIAIARDIYQEHGITGFWRGFKSACVLVSRIISWIAFALQSLPVESDLSADQKISRIYTSQSGG